MGRDSDSEGLERYGLRLFYAAFLSQENRIAYQVLVDRVMSDVPGALRPIPPESHHLTLAFLGEIADAAADTYVALLDTLEEVEAFDYSLAPPDLLMGRGRPRLIHAGVTDNREAITAVQTELLAGIARSGESIDTRPKPPHVTLARFKKNAKRWQARKVREALERIDRSSLPETNRFSSVHLVESTLTPTGPRYETIREIRLGARDER